jgi:peptidoglycan/LPS O-acetylase OafA/YrhL
MGDVLWRGFEGLGVPIFLVNSGFLITMLLLREERRDDRIDLRGFYVRRAFRLLPVYFLALALYTLLVTLGFADNPGDWSQRIWLFLTVNNEFAGHATFGHTWTLAVQEKFYIVWPLLAFAIPLTRRWRLQGTPALALLLIGVWVVAPSSYSSMYIPLLIGCTVALAMDRRVGFEVLRWLGHPTVFVALLILAAAVHILDESDGQPSIPFSLMVGLLLPGLVCGPAWLTRLVASRPLAYIGIRTYSIYLFHPIALSAVDQFMPAGDVPLVLLFRYAAVAIASLVGSAVLYRWIELPANGWGHRLAGSRTEAGTVPAARPGE